MGRSFTNREIVLFVLAAFLLGIAADRFFSLQSGTEDLSGFEPKPVYNLGNDRYTSDDIDGMISISKPEEVHIARKRALEFLFGSPELPTQSVSKIDTDVSGARYRNLPALKHSRKLLIEMEFGLTSNAYHFVPANSNGAVVLFHEGHTMNLGMSETRIAQLLDRGFAVVTFIMPLIGENSRPVVNLKRNGPFRLTDHQNLGLLKPKSGHAIRYFIEPVIRVMNYLDEHHQYTNIVMMGISGGGWTTMITAALDERILKSVPVAGSFPFYLRSGITKNWGDFEQIDIRFYSLVNYLELYLMGSVGKGKAQLQIFNEFDSCCFAGTGSKMYEAVIKRRLKQISVGGQFDVFLDGSHQHHEISDNAMAKILEFLKP
ncbi:MAG: hypothetical protein HKN33_13450 [Pyrinomonadaceae bacterium]|nr:hypothetical protein [Pyrinomonadaceae bacterium]